MAVSNLVGMLLLDDNRKGNVLTTDYGANEPLWLSVNIPTPTFALINKEATKVSEVRSVQPADKLVNRRAPAV